MNPRSAATFVELLSERAALHPERLALQFLHDGDPEQARLSYAELHARASALAAQLTERARPGERALLLYPSGASYVTALFACFYAGIVAVPAYPPQSREARHLARIISIASDAQPSLLLTEQALLQPLSAAQASVEALARVPLMATDGPSVSTSFEPPALARDGLAMLQYTSGSTSAPKGVMLTHGNLLANEAAIQDAFSIGDGDVIVSWLPLFHDMGLIGTLLQPLYAGVSAVLMAPQRFMERPRRWLDAISRYGATVSGAPDFAYRLCAQRVDPAEGEPLDLSSWRLAFCGAEPVRDQTLRAFADKFERAGFSSNALYPCYGLAEATLIVTGGSRGDGMRTQRFGSTALRDDRAQLDDDGQTLVSCGVARLGQELAIVQPETGEVLAEGAVGEVQVAGPSIARGYWNNPEATERTFVQRDGRVFLRTGDLGFVHERELYVTGRAKDMIIVRGQNLYPQDIERAIESENGVVRTGRVVAFSLEFAGEEGIAVVAEVNQRLLKLAEPQRVCLEITQLVARTFGEPPLLVLLLRPGAVPLTSSGKLQRAACKQAFLARELPVVSAFGRAAKGVEVLPRATDVAQTAGE